MVVEQMIGFILTVVVGSYVGVVITLIYTTATISKFKINISKYELLECILWPMVFMR